jgi:rhomboid family GlyGly-CTERM serine protease
MPRLVRYWDVVLLVAVLTAASVPLLIGGETPACLVYRPDLVARGEWWRVLTHPFAHVSRYHLLLDGAAVVSLLCALADRSAAARLAMVAASAAASLAAASLVPGETAVYGLCGLSGVGHGLMAGAAVLGLGDADPASRRAARVVLAVVVVKAAVEAVTGTLLLDLVHMGDLGRPNRLVHIGGVAGGALAALVLRHGRGCEAAAAVAES